MKKKRQSSWYGYLRVLFCDNLVQLGAHCITKSSSNRDGACDAFKISIGLGVFFFVFVSAS